MIVTLHFRKWHWGLNPRPCSCQASEPADLHLKHKGKDSLERWKGNEVKFSLTAREETAISGFDEWYVHKRGETVALNLRMAFTGIISL